MRRIQDWCTALWIAGLVVASASDTSAQTMVPAGGDVHPVAGAEFILNPSTAIRW
jgi:hypothetical protein